MSAVFDTLPEVLREPVEHWFERFGETTKADALARIVACSEFAGTVALREKEWLLENVASFEQAPDPQQLEIFVADVASTDADVAEVKSRLRRFRNRYMLHVLWREIFALGNLDETLHSLLLLADRLLDAASQYSSNALAPRYGNLRTVDGRPVPPVILGMGKLGGYELNFSSDVDLIFLYTEAGETDGARRISAQEYFGRWSRQVIALLDETTADGFVFRMDTRLRPFGDSGPPVVSFGALESYLLQHGRDWERYAYVKARIVGPQPGDEVAHELYRNMIKPFVYRRYIDFGVFESLREMHAMIAAEVQSRELQDNIKLGPGGIREAEFIVQSLQLVRGGREPQLQSRELQKILPLLVKSRGLSVDSAAKLRAAYRFLRRVENFIQAMRDRQTHDLPEADLDRSRLCIAMGRADWASLEAEIDRHRAAIAAQFDQVAFREDGVDVPFLKRVEQAWKAGAGVAEWTELLAGEGAPSAEALAESLATFANAKATQQVDTMSRERLQRFVPRLVGE